MAEGSGKRVSVISEDGAGSALQYLILKNNIANADSKPDTMIMLFRDTVLTSTAFRVHGNFLAMMDEFAGADDDLVLQLAIRDRMNPLEKLAEAYFPPTGHARICKRSCFPGFYIYPRAHYSAAIWNVQMRR